MNQHLDIKILIAHLHLVVLVVQPLIASLPDTAHQPLQWLPLDVSRWDCAEPPSNADPLPLQMKTPPPPTHMQTNGHDHD